MPYVKGTAPTSVLLQSGTDAPETDVPILAYTQQVPVLREEYAKIDYYELVHFLPVSLWRQLKDQIGCSGEDSFLCVRAGENATLEELNSIQGQIAQLLQDKHSIEQENRIQEYETNETQVQGMMVFFGGFCLLLALIGVGNVFSNTLGFVRQRRREFARYMSVGLTPQELRKMFCIEALVIAGRPVLITLPVTAAAVCLMLRASYMELGVFLAEAPVVPILVFMLAVVSTVALAYWLGWRSLRQISLSEVLRDDTML